MSRDDYSRTRQSDNANKVDVDDRSEYVSSCLSKPDQIQRLEHVSRYHNQLSSLPDLTIAEGQLQRQENHLSREKNQLAKTKERLSRLRSLLSSPADDFQCSLDDSDAIEEQLAQPSETMMALERFNSSVEQLPHFEYVDGSHPDASTNQYEQYLEHQNILRKTEGVLEPIALDISGSFIAEQNAKTRWMSLLLEMEHQQVVIWAYERLTLLIRYDRNSKHSQRMRREAPHVSHADNSLFKALEDFNNAKAEMTPPEEYSRCMLNVSRAGLNESEKEESTTQSATDNAFSEFKRKSELLAACDAFFEPLWREAIFRSNPEFLLMTESPVLTERMEVNAARQQALLHHYMQIAFEGSLLRFKQPGESGKKADSGSLHFMQIAFEWFLSLFNKPQSGSNDKQEDESGKKTVTDNKDENMFKLKEFKPIPKDGQALTWRFFFLFNRCYPWIYWLVGIALLLLSLFIYIRAIGFEINSTLNFFYLDSFPPPQQNAFSSDTSSPAITFEEYSKEQKITLFHEILIVIFLLVAYLMGRAVRLLVNGFYLLAQGQSLNRTLFKGVGLSIAVLFGLYQIAELKVDSAVPVKDQEEMKAKLGRGMVEPDPHHRAHSMFRDFIHSQPLGINKPTDEELAEYMEQGKYVLTCDKVSGYLAELNNSNYNKDSGETPYIALLALKPSDVDDSGVESSKEGGVSVEPSSQPGALDDSNANSSNRESAAAGAKIIESYCLVTPGAIRIKEGNMQQALMSTMLLPLVACLLFMYWKIAIYPLLRLDFYLRRLEKRFFSGPWYPIPDNYISQRPLLYFAGNTPSVVSDDDEQANQHVQVKEDKRENNKSLKRRTINFEWSKLVRRWSHGSTKKPIKEANEDKYTVGTKLIALSIPVIIALVCLGVLINIWQQNANGY